ncbi:nitrate- and nitrite sensing domain-containing protein [Nocardiopsis trehalosi]|uniref:nitrate- and nitrite sensing domain-containing protein n=1 Tax=Nocardiopsis trehalosi TaxID=109329 RepID=UPI000AD942FB|nr:nitrate- and nitrite sensing domain-containing protein [Nocardiopsis trehalosi]
MQTAKRRRAASIRQRSRRAVLMPATAFVALWLTVSSYLVWEAFQMVGAAKALDELSTPAAVSLVSVMDERSQTVAYLENPENRDQLDQTRRDSDALTQDVFDRFEPFRNFATDSIRERIGEFETQYRSISDIREKVDNGTASREEVLDDYNRVMRVAANLFDEQSRGHPEPRAIGPGLSATNTFRVVDLLAQSDAQLTRSFASGELTAADQQEFTRLTSSYHAILDSIREFMSPEQSRKLEELMAGDDYARLVEFEDEIIEREVTHSVDPVTGEEVHDNSIPIDQEEWADAYFPVKDALTDIGANESYHAADVQTDAATLALVLAVGGTVGVALLGFGAISYAFRTTNSVVRRLGQLRDETDTRANELLPALAARLRRNEEADTEGIPPLTKSEDEIGEVAESFDKAQRFAVEAAVRQAELRQGVNRVFLSIAHRSQTLIHRQLRLLDRMERDQEDPEQLTELFKLDHLATRSRRNAENLLILGGETPGRTWHRPMPLIDVLRGAISESGDYTRVERQHIARVSLKGPAVADVIHLVAELVDNATSFSPPHSQVRLSSEQVPNGVVIEIEDRGLGMQEKEFAAANEVLANPPEFDVMRLNEKMRLGLFVVSRLAHRHDIKVRLRTSPYGGVQAIVLLPTELIAGDPVALPGADGSEGADDEPWTPESGPRVSRAVDVLDEERPSGAHRAPRTPRPGAARNGNGNGTAENRTGMNTSTGNGAAGNRATGNGAADRAPAGNGSAPADGQEVPLRGDVLARGDAPDVPEVPAEEPVLPRRTPSSGWVGAEGRHATPGSLPRRGGTADSAPAAPSVFAPSVFAPSAPAAPPAPSADGDPRPALPRRTPQTHLAPQLYDAPDAPDAPPTAPAPPEEEQERSARLRRNMAAFQQGTRRGRREGQQRQNDTEKDSRP